MTKLERIEKLEQEVKALKVQLGIENNKLFPQKGDTYWYSSAAGEIYYNVANDSEGRLNCYKTKEDAVKSRDIAWAKQRVIAAIEIANNGWKPDWEDKNTDKYNFTLNTNDNSIYTSVWRQVKTFPNNMYMKSREVVEQIIKDYEEDLLLILGE